MLRATSPGSDCLRRMRVASARYARFCSLLGLHPGFAKAERILTMTKQHHTISFTPQGSLFHKCKKGLSPVAIWLQPEAPGRTLKPMRNRCSVTTLLLVL